MHYVFQLEDLLIDLVEVVLFFRRVHRVLCILYQFHQLLVGRLETLKGSRYLVQFLQYSGLVEW